MLAPFNSVLACGLALINLVDAVPTRAKERGNDGDLISFMGDRATDDIPMIRSQNMVLKPVRPKRPHKSKRDGGSVFQVLSEDFLYWAGDDGTITELRVDLSGAKEGLVDTEYFDNLIDSMECPRNATGEVKIHFSDNVDFNSAADIWKWVKQEDDHQFILMVGAGDCGWNEDRVLFQINDLDFNDPTETALLHAKPISWREALHSFDLNVGKGALESARSKRAMEKRGIPDFIDKITDALDGDYSPDVSIPFTNSMSGKSISFPIQGVDVTGKCVTCTTKGSFKIEAKFRVRLRGIEQAIVVMSTDGIDATAIIDLEVKGDVSEKGPEKGKSVSLVKASPAGVSIPKILTIGPTVGIAVEASVAAIKGAIKITLGGKASIPKSTATLDFLGKNKVAATGWGLKMDPDPLKAEVFVEAKASTSFTASVGVEISAIETGFAAELAAKLPSLAATLKRIESSACTACDKKYSSAVDGSVVLSSDLTVSLKKKVNGDYEKLLSHPLAEKTLAKLASFCKPVGKQQCPAKRDELPW